MAILVTFFNKVLMKNIEPEGKTPMNMKCKSNKLSYPYAALICIVAITISAMPAANAADKASRERQALRVALEKLRQAEDQRDSLAQEKDKLTQELSDLKKQSVGLQHSAASAKSRNAALQKELEALKEEHQATREKLQSTVQELADMTRAEADTTKRLNQAEAQAKQEKQHLEGVVARRDKAIQVCEDKNLKLYQYDTELIDKYRSKGVFDSLLQAEPVTQIKSVEMENILQEYKDKLSDQRIKDEKNK